MKGFLFIAINVGGAVGWWAGGFAGIMGSCLGSIVGSLGGIWLVWKARGYLE